MLSNLRGALQILIWTATLCPLALGLRAQAPSSPAPAQSLISSEDQQVVAVRVVRESGEVLNENPAELPLQPGQLLDAEAVRKSLHWLHRTGRYADLRAETTPVSGGLRVDFVVRWNLFVNSVRVTGLREPPGEPLALASLRLSLGEPFRESSLKEALDRLQQTLRDEGLYQARVSYDFSPHPDTRQMDITVRVEPGPRAHVGAVTLRNLTELSDTDLLSRSKLHAGQEVTFTRLNRAAERMRKALVRRDYLGARVNIRRGAYDAQSNSLPLEIEVAAGPRVRVEVTGAKIRDKELRKLLPIYQEGTVDEDLLQEGRRAIRDYVEREGYFDVQVSYWIAEAAREDLRGRVAAEQVITYQVERGERHRLVGVAFDGNSYFSDELLLGQLRLQPAVYASRGRFSRRLVDLDATSLRELYIANGFREAVVRTELEDNYRGKHGDLFVRFRIDEGSQTRVAELKIEGNQALSDDELLAVIGSTPGQPYSEFNISGDRDNILAVYYNEGFPEARFTATVEEVPQPSGSPAAAGESKHVRLIYRLVEGPQVRVVRVLIGGYEHTRPNVVAREVKMKPGGPLREGDVVETQRGLYNLGIFSRVSIAPQNPAGSDMNKTVVVLVEEGKRYTLAYGGGFEVQRLGGVSDPVGGEFRASPRALFEITKANLTGRADTLSFKARASTIQGRSLLSYAAPNTFGRRELSLQLTGLADRTSDVLTFTSTRYEGSLQLAQRVSLVTSLLYRYSFRRVTVSSLKIEEQEIQLRNQPTLVSQFGATWVRERRDNPADALRGDFNSADVSVAAKPIGSGATFLRVLVQNSTYHPLGRRFSFARSTRFGFEHPFGGSTSDSIPLPERFFAGGGMSLRGFGLNQAGPRSASGFPIGGLAMLIFNQELRFPMRLPFFGSRVGGTLFYDAGNVFSDVDRITFRSNPPLETDLNYFSHTIGFGFRYATPIGPVRVDLGYQLNAPRFQFCAVGGTPDPRLCPSGQGITTRRLPRFQIFFNLGAIF